MDDLELAQGTAYSYVNQLVDAGIVHVTDKEQPRRYTAREIDLTVTTAAGDREYTITPELIDAAGRRETNGDIDTYIARHDVAGLATTLTYAVARERGEVTHRLMAEDLDISPLAAETILQALRPVVHEHYDIEAARTDGDGKGFAVVANEIKLLAEQSQTEVDDIEETVGEIRDNAGTTVKSVEAANRRIETVVDRTESLVENQETIVEVTSETSTGLAEISKATDSQAATAEDIATRIKQTTERAATIADESDDIAAANEQQSARIQNINGSVQRVIDHLNALE